MAASWSSSILTPNIFGLLNAGRRSTTRGKTQDYVEQAMLTSITILWLVILPDSRVGTFLPAILITKKDSFVHCGTFWPCIIGDYEEYMLILLSVPPLSCPSANFAGAHRVGFCTQVKCASFSPLSQLGGGDPFWDRNGTAIQPEGNVENFDETSTLVAAFYCCLHPRHAQGGNSSKLHTKICQACNDHYWI